MNGPLIAKMATKRFKFHGWVVYLSFLTGAGKGLYYV